MLNLKRIVPLSMLVLGLLSAGAASASAEKARSYEMSVNAATKVGTQILKAGEYKVSLEGSNAVFTKQGSKSVITAPAKLEAGSEKFDRTVIHQVQDAGQSRIISIELKGCKDLLKFD